MHAVVVDITVKDPVAGAEMLMELVPKIASAPGFVTGWWLAVGESNGHSVVVFESEEAAQAAAETAVVPPEAPIAIDSVKVCAVVAHV
jgi:hypothetical protein